MTVPAADESSDSNQSAVRRTTDPSFSPHSLTLTPEQFGRVRELFNRVSVMAPGERQAFLDAECGDDSSLKAATDELLSVLDVTMSRFNPDGGGIALRALGSASFQNETLPELIGPFRIQRLIGRGGMGSVYLATQQNPDREVALKILRTDSDAASALRSRFAREVRLLGRLEHPGIARLYEAGTQATAQGFVSFFAMEYVRGSRITDYAARNSLSIAQKLELAARIADAVQHAHSKGIIHRDLKPANILVTDEVAPAHAGSDSTAMLAAQPKILDFGVARLLEPDAAHTQVTEQGLLVGTIGYMSPEQLSGDLASIDTRTDVYALGVIIYELIAGKPPFDVREKPIPEAARIIRDDEPIALSIAIPTQQLDRDIITIISKAMAKDRSRRYATASALADDLRRYLRSEPIAARPLTLAYQLRKFANRRRGLVAACSVFAVAVVVGIVMISTLYIKEQRARGRADHEALQSKAVRSYLMHNLLLSASPDMLGYEVKMLDALKSGTATLHDTFADHPEIEADIRADLAQLYSSLGKFAESIEQGELALHIFDEILGQENDRSIAVLNFMSGALLEMSQPQSALAKSEEAWNRAQRTPREDTDPFLCTTLSTRGQALAALNRHEEAIAALEDSNARMQRSVPIDHESILANKTWLLGSRKALGQTENALAECRSIVDLTLQLKGPESPGSLSAQLNLVKELVRAKQNDEATTLAASLPALADKIFPQGHPDHAQAYLTAANTLPIARRFEEAEHYGVAAYAAFVAGSDDLNWQAERAAGVLRNIYRVWPGHATQWLEQAKCCLRVRLMVANVDERSTTFDAVRQLDAEFKGVKLDRPEHGIAEMLWNEREELAPPDHPRRAAMLANLALVFAAQHRDDRRDQALELSRQALPQAHDPAVVEALINAATPEPAASP